eukprot:6312884-Amphidinium_carterae.1
MREREREKRGGNSTIFSEKRTFSPISFTFLSNFELFGSLGIVVGWGDHKVCAVSLSSPPQPQASPAAVQSFVDTGPLRVSSHAALTTMPSNKKVYLPNSKDSGKEAKPEAQRNKKRQPIPYRTSIVRRHNGSGTMTTKRFDSLR